MDTGCTAEHRQPSASWGPPGSRRWLQRAAIWGQEVWQKQSPEPFLLLSVTMKGKSQGQPPALALGP